MLMSSDVHGQVVAIAGACSEAGAAMARALAGKGAVLMLGDGRLSGLQALATRIREEGGCAQYRAVDPSRQASIDLLIAHTVDAYGRIDLLLKFGAEPRQTLGQRPGVDGRLPGPSAPMSTRPAQGATPQAWMGRALRAAHP